jgi:hypothetical protein
MSQKADVVMEEALENYLVAMAKSPFLGNKEWPHPNMEHLVLHVGFRMPAPSPLPKWLRKGTPKMCFRNCLNAVKRHPDKLTYCEGFASGSVIPVIHAWLLSSDGLLFDPTWGTHRSGIQNQYHGIPIMLEYALEIFKQRKSYSVIDNWEGGFPMLSGEHDHTRFRKAGIP